MFTSFNFDFFPYQKPHNQSKASQLQRRIGFEKILLRHLVQTSDGLKKVPKYAVIIESSEFSNCFLSLFISLTPSVKFSTKAYHFPKHFLLKKFHCFLRRNPSSPKVPDTFQFVVPGYSISHCSRTISQISFLKHSSIIVPIDNS